MNEEKLNLSSKFFCTLLKVQQSQKIYRDAIQIDHIKRAKDWEPSARVVCCYKGKQP